MSADPLGIWWFCKPGRGEGEDFKPVFGDADGMFELRG